MYPNRGDNKNITELEKQDGVQLIRGIKKKIYTDIKNGDKYKTILTTAEDLFKKNELGIDEISHLDMLLNQVIFQAKEAEDVVSKEKVSVKIETVTPLQICNDVVINQNNTPHSNDGDVVDQPKPESAEPQSLYPTLNFSSKDYNTSKLNKDIAHLFVSQSSPPNLNPISTIEEVDPKKLLEDKTTQFSEQLKRASDLLNTLIADRQQNKNNVVKDRVLETLKVRLDFVIKLSKLFEASNKSQIDVAKLQRYETNLRTALEYKLPADKLNAKNETSVATNKSSLVNNFPVKEKPQAQKSVKKKAMAI